MFETEIPHPFNQQEKQTIATTIRTSSQKWLSWVNEAINYSKEKNSIVIIVDKLFQICKIYNQGEPVFSFPVELGENPFSDKIAPGDNATQNGKYYITGKKEDFHPPYNKLLQINYTNHSDTSGLENPGMQTPDILQGKIYLHGGGGQGANWTNGSISLTDTDMNKVFNLVKIGTPVIIVGTFDNSLINSLDNGTGKQ
jgi:murein L,D-transpeptidase YafK